MILLLFSSNNISTPELTLYQLAYKKQVEHNGMVYYHVPIGVIHQSLTSPSHLGT